MNAQDIRHMTDEEIAAALDGARQEMFNLRFRVAGGQQSDTSRMRQVRRDVARLLTVQRERHLGSVEDPRG